MRTEAIELGDVVYTLSEGYARAAVVEDVIEDSGLIIIELVEESTVELGDSTYLERGPFDLYPTLDELMRNILSHESLGHEEIIEEVDVLN